MEKAQAFFARARKVAKSNNFDYAIEMYLEGLRCAPDALVDGHARLRELALLRQGKGGKKPTMLEKMKLLRGKKDPIDKMLAAEYMLAKDPDHLPYAEDFLKASVSGGYHKTAGWIANLIFQANNASEKPSVAAYILLKDSYLQIGAYDRAIAACEHAAKLKPSDASLDEEYKQLTAERTVSKGKYDQEGSFRDSIQNRDAQDKLQAQSGAVKSDNYRQLALDDARHAYSEDPNLAKNIYNLANTLTEMHTYKAYNEAVVVLEKAYQEKSDFSFKQQAGEIRIKQIKRNIRAMKAAIEKNPGDAESKGKLAKLMKLLNTTEMTHYRLWVENRPTDLAAKYEYGSRLVSNKQFDEAIPILQDAQRDPRHSTLSMNKIGRCFFFKGWYADSIDIFRQALDCHELKDDGIGKELRYNLAHALEKDGKTEEALGIYRKLAQLDFGFKDVRERVAKLRDIGNGSTSQ